MKQSIVSISSPISEIKVALITEIDRFGYPIDKLLAQIGFDLTKAEQYYLNNQSDSNQRNVFGALFVN
jgi:hypothetical protein